MINIFVHKTHFSRLHFYCTFNSTENNNIMIKSTKENHNVKNTSFQIYIFINISLSYSVYRYKHHIYSTSGKGVGGNDVKLYKIVFIIYTEEYVIY